MEGVQYFQYSVMFKSYQKMSKRTECDMNRSERGAPRSMDQERRE